MNRERYLVRLKLQRALADLNYSLECFGDHLAKEQGYRRMPSSTAFRAINVLVPELTQSSWSRNWKPFFEKLVAKCEIEESHADLAFQRITRA